MTPLLLAVQDAPVPFMGSDGHVHLVYELEMTNFSSAEILVEKVEVLGDGVSLQTLDTAAVAERLQPAGSANRWERWPRARGRYSFSTLCLLREPKFPRNFHIACAKTKECYRTSLTYTIQKSFQLPLLHTIARKLTRGNKNHESCWNLVRRPTLVSTFHARGL